jgi:hypothetical protein
MVKYGLEPDLKVVYMDSFSNAEQKDILKIISENYELLKMKWYEYFSK